MAEGIVKWFSDKKGFGLSKGKTVRTFLFTTQQ
jgi:cold shock CspA family protein